jgi:PAS domain S-box-containing protein
MAYRRCLHHFTRLPLPQSRSAEALRLAIVDLARNPIISAGDRERAFRLVTQSAASSLDIERCSIWLYNASRDKIVCQDLYRRTEDSHSKGLTLSYAKCPTYFRALDEERIINADEAMTDSRTSEFAETYLRPLNIVSMLDAPIRLGGVVVGVICQEQVDERRVWTQEEEEFAAAIGDLIALAMDLSERRQAEQALRESEELFRSVTYTATDAMICTDPNGKVTIWNRAATTIFGIEPSEAMGKSLEELQVFHQTWSWTGGQASRGYVDLGIDGAKVREMTGNRRGGAPVPIEVSLATFQRADGQHVTYIIRDTTTRKRMEEEREAVAQRTQQIQKLESLGVLAGGIAHDFNNLLGASLGRLELVRLTDDAAKQIAHLDVIETTMKRAADLCRQLLAYSGRGAFIDEFLDLNSIFMETVGIINMSISKKASLVFHLEEGLPSFLGDPAQIQQVILNLLTNASDALEDGEGTIEVRTGQKFYSREEIVSASYSHDEPGYFLFLEVRDTGVGMLEGVRERIFEPFFTTKFTGRGLGMAAVLGIVGRYEGAIFVESTRGIGTQIRVIFPTDGAPLDASLTEVDVGEHEPFSSAVDSHLSRIITVLVIDDEEEVRTTFVLFLEQAGFQVVSAQDGVQGLAIFAESPLKFDCVLLDLVMPKMNGQETLRHMRKIRGDIPIVLTSGYSAKEIEMRFLDENPTVFLQKPFKMKALVDTIGRVLSE